jgi:hypothetical protein
MPLVTSKVMIDEEFSDANRHWLLYTRKGESAQLIVRLFIACLFAKK